jgi:hypothetical protein
MIAKTVKSLPLYNIVSETRIMTVALLVPVRHSHEA